MNVRFGAQPPLNPLAAKRAAALQQQRDKEAIAKRQAEETQKHAESKALFESCQKLLTANVLAPMDDIPGMNGVEVLSLLSHSSNKAGHAQMIEIAGGERVGYYFTKTFLAAQGFDPADIAKILESAGAMAQTGILTKVMGKIEGQQQMTQDVIRGYELNDKGRKLLAYLATLPSGEGTSPVATP